MELIVVLRREPPGSWGTILRVAFPQVLMALTFLLYWGVALVVYPLCLIGCWATTLKEQMF